MTMMISVFGLSGAVCSSSASCAELQEVQNAETGKGRESQMCFVRIRTGILMMMMMMMIIEINDNND